MSCELDRWRMEDKSLFLSCFPTLSASLVVVHSDFDPELCLLSHLSLLALPTSQATNKLSA